MRSPSSSPPFPPMRSALRLISCWTVCSESTPTRLFSLWGRGGGIAIITIIAAVCLAPDGRFLVIPFVVIALLALFGGIVARPYGLMVGALMLVQSAAIWLMTARRAR